MAIQSKTILAIVEDDPSLRKALARLLSVFGYRVESFASGAEFLTAVATTEAKCLILDIQLSETNGLALARQLSAAGFRIPIIFMTASDDSSLRNQCLALGGIAFLQKPFEASELKTVIQTLLNKHPIQFPARPVRHGDESRSIFDDFLEEAIRITSADMGTFQLVDNSAGALRIITHRGFDAPFLNFFALVRGDDDSACATALKQSSRVVVPDVQTSPIFADRDSKDVLRVAGVRAVQSTPLFARSRNLIGIISTHWRSVTLPTVETLQELDYLAQLAAQKIAL